MVATSRPKKQSPLGAGFGVFKKVELHATPPVVGVVLIILVVAVLCVEQNTAADSGSDLRMDQALDCRNLA